MKKKEKISSRTYIQGEKIYWISGKRILTRIPINDIKIIGEYTTDGGPYKNDWFLVFITSLKDIREISVYALGAEEMLKELGQQINSRLSVQLANSSDWKSIILWPNIFYGKELFSLTPKQPANFREKLKSMIGFSKIEIGLTDELIKYLG